MEAEFAAPAHFDFDYDKSLDPDQYRQLLDANAYSNVNLANNERIRFVDTKDVNAVEQCNTVLTQWLSDRCTRGIISYPNPTSEQRPCKRKRVTQNITFPTHVLKPNGSKRRVNQGKGGDLNFLPSPSPVICKQSCGFCGVQPGDSTSQQVKFYSYTISSVDQDWASPQRVRIVHISTSDIGSTKRLELTTDSEHQLKSQASHGQLHGLGPDIQTMLLKVRKSTPPDARKFDVTLAYETSLGNEHELTAKLASGQVEFRECWKPDPANYLVHTVLEKLPDNQGITMPPYLDAHASMQAEFVPVVQPAACPSTLPALPEPSTETTDTITALEQLLVHKDADVHGTLTVNNFVHLSDERIKENITTLQADALLQLSQLRLVTYTLVQCLQKQQKIGFLAQNVQDVLPSAVVVSPDSGLLGVSPYVLLAVAIKGIQQLHELIKGLSLQINQQQKQHNRLGLQISQLQQQDQALSMRVLQLEASRAQAHTSFDNKVEAETSSDSQADSFTVLQPAHSTMLSDSADSAQTGQGPMQPNTAQSQPLPFHGASDIKAQVQCVLDMLQETAQRTSISIKCEKSIISLGSHTVWGCCVAACSGTSNPTNVFCKLLSQKSLQMKVRMKAKSVSTEPLRDYQLKLVEAASSGNHILVLPTGTGKTRIAVELGSRLLKAKPTNRIVFLVPTVTLAEQQAAAFMAGISQTGGTAECFSSENPINSRNWATTIAAVSVIVMTAQSFLNVLQDNTASFQDIALMVIDECHHSYDKHPFNDVLAHYRQQSPVEQSKTQIIGLTASPGTGRDLSAAYASQEQVCRNMSATFLIWSEDDTFQQYAPQPEHIVYHVTPRQQDSSFATALASVISEHSEGLAALQLDCLQAAKLMTEVRGDLNKSSWSARLEGWLSDLLSPESCLPAALHPYATLLRACNTALNMAKDTGYEAAMLCLGSACTDATAAAQQTGSNTSDAATQCAMSVAKLVQSLTARVCSLSSVTGCLRSGTAAHAAAFPKFLKLVQFLAEMKEDKAAWHGMVFVKERQAVFELTRMLQSASQLHGINFYAFTGQGKNAAHRSNTATAQQGMERKSTFQRFQQATGWEVLVATSAAEEGIDVPSCEFVACYTVVQSGRERTQKQGRARAIVSKFVEFIEIGSMDAVMHKKSCEEQVSSQLALLQRMHLQNGV